MLIIIQLGTYVWRPCFRHKAGSSALAMSLSVGMLQRDGVRAELEHDW